MPDYEMTQQDKKVLQMTRDGLTRENVATGESENISSKKIDCEYHKQEEIETAYKNEKNFFNKQNPNQAEESSMQMSPKTLVNYDLEEESGEENGGYTSPYNHGEYRLDSNPLKNAKEQIADTIHEYREIRYSNSKRRYEHDRNRKELGNGNQKQTFNRDFKTGEKKNFKRSETVGGKTKDYEFSRSGSRGTGKRKYAGQGEDTKTKDGEERRFDKYSRKIEKTEERIKKLQEQLPTKRRLKFEKTDSQSRLKFRNEPLTKHEYLKMKHLSKNLWNSWAESRRENRDMLPGSMMSTTKKGLRYARSIDRKWNRSVRKISQYTNPYARLERAEKKAANYRMRRDEEDYKRMSPEKKKIQKMMQKKRNRDIAMRNKMLKGQQNYVQHRKFTKKAKDAVAKMVKAVKTFVSIVGSLVSIFLILIGLLFGGFFILAVCIGYGGDAIVDSTYQADYNQISECSAYMQSLETDLKERISKIETEEYPGYYEYIYNLGEIRHNSIELMSYLAAKFVEFDLEKCREEMNELFGEMYTLLIEIKEEPRERAKRDEDGDIIYDADGNPVMEEFTAQICYITLEVKPLEEIIGGRLDAEQKKYYDTYMMSSGGQQVYTNCLEIDWTGSISSKFGERIHPITGKRTFHNGIDIAVPLGTSLNSSVTGVVTTSAYSESAGNFIIITMENGWSVVYMHLDSRNVSAGDMVKRGQFIGETGNSGNSTGPHLHLEVRNKDNLPVDPTFIIPSSSSIKDG